MKNYLPIPLIFFLVINLNQPCKAQLQGADWQTINADTVPTKRHENAYTKVGDKFYLVGGRGMKPVDIYDPWDNSWATGAQPPIEMHHIQAIGYHGLLYIVGGLTGGYPYEKPLSNIYIYNPENDQWMVGPEIPEARQRGAAGTFVYDNKIYMVGGIVNGHTSNWVPWFDEYDPVTNTWQKLPDAPRTRDHFHAGVVDDRVYVVGGRRSGKVEGAFAGTVSPTDYFDFSTGEWLTIPSPAGDIPTPRAGCTVAVVDGKVIVIGGESPAQEAAHNDVEILDTQNHTWSSLDVLQNGRHGTQAIVAGGSIYLAAGSGDRGGGPELNSQEILEFNPSNNDFGESVDPGELVSNVNSLNFGKINPYNKATETITLSNKNGNQGIIISYAMITGSSDFQVDFPYEIPYVLLPGTSVDVKVHFTPTTQGSKTGELAIKRDINAEPIRVKLNGKSGK